MPRITIAQRLALLAVAVALVMTIAICLLSFLKGRAVLTEHEVVNLADDCNLRMFELREEFRYISREVRDTAAALPKPSAGQPLAEFTATGPFRNAMAESIRRLAFWAGGHGHRSASSWVDFHVVHEIIYLGVNSAGESQRLARNSWETIFPVSVDGPGGPLGFQIANAINEPAHAELALADIEKQLKDVARNPRPSQPRQLTSGIHPMRGDSSRRTGGR